MDKENMIWQRITNRDGKSYGKCEMKKWIKKKRDENE